MQLVEIKQKLVFIEFNVYILNYVLLSIQTYYPIILYILNYIQSISHSKNLVQNLYTYKINQENS